MARTPRRRGHQVRRVVGAATLPRRPGQGRAERGHEAGVGIGGHQTDPGQAPGDQAAPERRPARAVLGTDHLDAEDFPVSVGVHSRGDQGVDVDHPPALADLERQGVRRDERVRANVQRPGPERRHRGVEIGGHPRDLRLAQARDPEGLDQAVHPPGGDPEQIAGRHHARERQLGPLAPLKQPLREVRPRAQLRDRDVHRPGSGVEISVPAAVAGVRPLLAALAVAGTADRVDFRPHQRGDQKWTTSRAPGPARRTRVRGTRRTAPPPVGVGPVSYMSENFRCHRVKRVIGRKPIRTKLGREKSLV